MPVSRIGEQGRRRMARRGPRLVQRGCQPRGPRTAAAAVTHFFNHQTHHRGQVHAMLTPAGQDTGDTDLILVSPDIVGPSPA